MNDFENWDNSRLLAFSKYGGDLEDRFNALTVLVERIYNQVHLMDKNMKKHDDGK